MVDKGCDFFRKAFAEIAIGFVDAIGKSGVMAGDQVGKERSEAGELFSTDLGTGSRVIPFS